MVAVLVAVLNEVTAQLICQASSGAHIGVKATDEREAAAKQTKARYKPPLNRASGLLLSPCGHARSTYI